MSRSHKWEPQVMSRRPDLVVVWPVLQSGVSGNASLLAGVVATGSLIGWVAGLVAWVFLTCCSGTSESKSADAGAEWLANEGGVTVTEVGGVPGRDPSDPALPVHKTVWPVPHEQKSDPNVLP